MDHEPWSGDQVTLTQREGEGDGKMCHGAFSYARTVALVLLLLVLFVGVTFLDPHVASAAQERTPDLLEEGGRKLETTDWLWHLPLALGAALVVIVVDAIVILRILLGRRRRR